MASDWQALEKSISTALDESFRVRDISSIGGGDINRAYLLTDQKRRFFVKMNSAQRLPMFDSEMAALTALRATRTIRVPQPICTGADSSQSWLALEYIELDRPGENTGAELGEQLAALHRSSAATFGWERDNTIGTTPQINTQGDNWQAFFARQRLGYQLTLAAQNGAGGKLRDSGQRLVSALDAFFGTYSPLPSLLHGDLWGGNWAADDNGHPVIFDPASYYGDREADLAMTELFGGFGDRFYQSYMSVWAIDPGYKTRKVLYNLYHVLNHFNLFGGGYARQAQDMIDSLLTEVS